MKKFFLFIQKHLELISVLTLLFSVAFLRLYDLGYSEFSLDEPGTFLFRGLPDKYPMSWWEFILSQKKGPLQILVGLIPYLIVGNYRNEFAQRLPFAVLNIGAVLVLYFLVKKWTKSKFIGFLAAFLFGVNGFVVAFGRIAQYQSLNVFFSFLALWFYSIGSFDSNARKTVSLRCLLGRTAIYPFLLGTLFFSLSLLAHWDVIYILPIVIFIFVEFLGNKNISRKEKSIVLAGNLVLGCVLLLPFLIPYIKSYDSSVENQMYFVSRFGLRESFDSTGDIFTFKLYHPFVAFEFYVVFTVLGMIFDLGSLLFKKFRTRFSGAATLWFVFCFIIFKFFMHHSGTHIYNLTIPAGVLCAIALGILFLNVPKFLKPVLFAAIGSLLIFLYYQSYLVFVDHKIEYPWDQEHVLGMSTQSFSHEDNIRHLIGFPLRRNWKEINEFITAQNELLGETFGYTTNEDKALSGFYMDVDYRSQDGFYAVGVKRPLSFVNDYKFSQLRGKKTVYKIQNEYGDTIVRVYRVEESD